MDENNVGYWNGEKKMINYSRQLIEAARAVLADGYYDCQNMQPDDLAVFQQSIASRAPEAERFNFNQLRELIDIVNSHEDHDPDYEWIDTNEQSSQRGPDENNEEETFAGGEDEEEDANDSDEEIEDPAVKQQENKRRALEAINHVLNIYYPYKTLSAATDFDRLRALFAEEVPDLAENISDERLKMLLFAVGGTLIGQLRPREERLAEAKRREANPGSVPRARSYESVRPSRVAPRSTAYDSYNKLNSSTQESDSSSLNDNSDSTERSLDADAEEITRTFNSPRARLSQLRQNSPVGRAYASSSNNANSGYGTNGAAEESTRRYDGAPASNGYPSRYGERPNYGERPRYGSSYDRQGYDRQGYDRQGYDRYGTERQGYDRYGYDRSEYSRDNYSERPYGSDRYHSSSRPCYNDRQGGYQRQGGYSRYNGGYQTDGYQNGRSCDSGANGYSERQNSYPDSGYRNNYSNGGYTNGYTGNGYSTGRQQGYSSLQEYRNSQSRAANESFGTTSNSRFNAGSNATPAASNPADPPLADVVRVMREILTNYFPEKQVRLGADFRRLRILTGFKFPQAKFSDDKLQMFVAYAGGSLLGVAQTGDSESLLTSADYSTRKEEELREVAAQVLRFFPGGLVDEAQGFDKFRALFNARFDEGSVSVSDETLKKFIHAVGGVLPGQDETKDVNAEVDERFTALVDVARVVLETRFSHSVFKRDLSDFTRFRIQFERLAGSGATLDDSELRDVFVAAGGVFEEEPEPQVKKRVVKLARSVMIKKVVAENFPNGLDGNSHEDLDLFRQRAKDYDFNFDEETDVKLYAIVARCCVRFDNKVFAVSEEGKSKIKSLVDSLFSVGTQVIYYETYFEKNADWLKEYNVGCSGLLVTLLANYFADYLFYPDYFEKNECADSERVKIMREIERVWGAAETMTPEALAERLYAPVERIRKALEISVENYAQKGDAFVHSAAPSQSTVDNEELDDEFDACFEAPASEENKSDSDAHDDEEKEEEIDDYDGEEFDDEESEEESEEVDDEDSSTPTLFDALLKELEEEKSDPSVLPDADSEVSQEQLDAQQETLAELLRAYFPEGFDVESEDALTSLKTKAENDGRALIGSDAQIVEQIKNSSLLSGGRCFAVTQEAKNYVGEKLDEWFDAGGKLLYYAIFWKKQGAELTSGGVFNESVLLDVMKKARPNYVYYDSYMEATKSDKPELAKVKEEILRFWTTDVARRVSDFESALYIPKATAAETFQNDSDFTPSSNGYWTKTKSAKAKSTRGTKSAKTASKKGAPRKSASKPKKS